MANQSRSFGSEIIQVYNLQSREYKDGEFEGIYPLQVKPRLRHENVKLRFCQFGMSKPGTKIVNILVIGTIGSGKNTAVNALINYLANVEYEDDHRLEIVSLDESERKNIQRGQAERETDWITVYEICEMANQKIKFQVNIVDTPGFGDTRGKQRDDQTFEQIKHLFQYGLTTVDAVCVCLNGLEPRLTDRQKYIFDSVMKCFGKDITKNLFIWATFTDVENPPVLGSIDAYGMEYVDHFSFENGALYEKIPENKRRRMKSKGKFEDVYETFDEFFKKIKTISPQNLENSMQDLEERKKLRIPHSEIERCMNYLNESLTSLHKALSELQRIALHDGDN